MVRGAIIEMTRGESVSILLPNGETRVFNLAQVEYAGPVAGAPAIGGGTAPEAAPSPVPPPPPPAPPPAPPLAPPPPPEEPRVHFESAEPLTFGIHTSTADADLGGWRGNLHLRIENYDKLCTSPCDAKLPKGSYQFSVTQDKSTVATDNEVPVKPGDTVHGEYQSYRGLRIAGVVTMIVGGTAGLIYALSYSKTNPEDCDYHSNDYSACLARSSDSSDMSQHLYVGLGVSLGSIVVGSIMLWKKDEASIRVTPGVAPPPGGVGVSDRRSALGYDPRGLTLRASF